jgi:hypothetical protein
MIKNAAVLCPNATESLVDQPAEAMSVVCVGADERGHRHIVHCHQANIVAFLCGRWRPEASVVRVENLRRHRNVCHTCYKAWERLSKGDNA